MLSISDDQLEEAEDAPLNPNYKQIDILDLKNIKEYFGINQHNLNYATELGLLIERVNVATLVSYFQIWDGPAKWYAPFDGPNSVTPNRMSIRENAYYADSDVGITVNKDGEQIFIVEIYYRILPPTIQVKYLSIDYRVWGTKTYIVPRGRYYIALKKDNKPETDDINSTANHTYSTENHIRFFDNNDDNSSYTNDGVLWTMDNFTGWTTFEDASKYAAFIDFSETFIKFDIDRHDIGN